VPWENQELGSFSLKFNLHLHGLAAGGEEFMADQPFVEDWMSRFYDIGWRGKGGGKEIGKRGLGDSEYDGWSKVMKYHPDDKQYEDFRGASGEERDLERFFVVLQQFVEAIASYGDRFSHQTAER
jgi:hypothetical protein